MLTGIFFLAHVCRSPPSRSTVKAIIFPWHEQMKFICLRRAGLLILTILFCTALLNAEDSAKCKETRYGKCFNVHGRYNIYADGDAIWIIGTHRRLEAADARLDEMLEQAGWQNHSIFGDFLVCPESQYELHHRQAVCVQSYKNIRLGQWK